MEIVYGCVRAALLGFLIVVLANCGQSAVPAATASATPEPAAQVAPRETARADAPMTLAPTLVSPTAASAQPALGSGPDVPIQRGQVFQLRVGQQVQVEDLSLAFTAVLEDSRCPEGAECVWEGQVRIALAAGRGGRMPEAIEMTLRAGRPADLSSVQIGAYRVELVSVIPYPQAGGSKAPDGYTATLVVR